MSDDNNGWIKLYRKIREHPFWTERRVFSRAEAWQDILMSANHSDSKEMIKGRLIHYKRSEWHTSELKLCDRWMWSRKKVRYFLNTLLSEGMIALKGTPDGTTITVANYEFYNSQGPAKGTPEDTPEDTPKDTPEDTQNKKNKKNKEDKKYIYSANAELNKAILDFIDMRKKIKKPMTDKAISLMIGRLNSLADIDDKKIDILNQSIVNSWQNVYELKSNKGDGDNGQRVRANSKTSFGTNPSKHNWANEGKL